MTRPLSRIVLPVLAGAVLLAGCGTSSNEPETYSSGGGEVERNHMEACLEANDGMDEAEEFCRCTWEAFSEEVNGEPRVPFSVYLDFDQTIRERIADAGDNRGELQEIARNVVNDWNQDHPDDRLEVDLIELIEDCRPDA